MAVDQKGALQVGSEEEMTREYPEQWLSLARPEARARLIYGLDDIARDPVTGLNWPPPPDDISLLMTDTFEEIVDEWDMFATPAQAWLGAAFLDQAEVEAAERFIAHLKAVLPLEQGFPTMAEAHALPGWSAVATTAAELRRLLTRWGRKGPEPEGQRPPAHPEGTERPEPQGLTGKDPKDDAPSF